MGTKIILIVIALFSFNSLSQTIDNPIKHIGTNMLDGVWYQDKEDDNILMCYFSGEVAPLEYLEKLVTSKGGNIKTPVINMVINGTRYKRFNLENGDNIVFANDKSHSKIFWNK